MRPGLLRAAPAILMFLAAALAVSAGGVGAQPAAAKWDLAQLMQQLAAVKTASAHFVEHRYLRMLKEPLVDSGTLFYRAPDQLRKDTLEPQVEKLSIDRDILTIDREGKSQTLQLKDYPELWAIIEGIRGTLAGDRSALENYYIVTLHGSAESWQLSLVPRDPKIEKAVRSVLISGDGAHIRRIVTDEGQGDRSEMTITEDKP